MTDGPPARRHGLTTIRGNLCDAQFPYEDRFQDERHRLCSQWMHHAREALQGGEVDLTDLDAALTALGLTPNDLQVIAAERPTGDAAGQMLPNRARPIAPNV